MSEELLTSETLRLRLADVATRVATTGATCGIQAVRNRPRYQMAPVAIVDPEQVRSSVPVGPDEFRRHFSEIRALVRIDDIPFGIVLHGTLTAIFRRHPAYRPVAAERYREQSLALRREVSSDLDARLTLIEKTFAAKLADHEARINALVARAGG